MEIGGGGPHTTGNRFWLSWRWSERTGTLNEGAARAAMNRNVLRRAYCEDSAPKAPKIRRIFVALVWSAECFGVYFRRLGRTVKSVYTEKGFFRGFLEVDGNSRSEVVREPFYRSFPSILDSSV